MMNVYCFAGVPVRIQSMYDAVNKHCEEYRFNGIPSFDIYTEETDIDFERKKAQEIYGLEQGSAIWTAEELEIIAVYRKFAEKMPEYDGFVFHGSAIAVDGKAYIFTAKSGVGKSTHTRLWREMLGTQAEMINDDKPVIRFEEDVPMVHGTPWAGKESLSKKIAKPLRAICIIERANQNRICEISKRSALPFLFQQAYRPYSRTGLEKTMKLIDQLDVRFYHLWCNMERNAAELSYRIMSEIKEDNHED